MLEQLPDRQLGTRLVRHERAVDGCEPEAREVIRGVARGIEVENEPHLLAEALERELAHPAVSAAAAVGRPDAHAGEVPVAYAALAGGATVSADELRAWVAPRVPEPAAAPKRVDVVQAIPLTAVGKPFKPELRRRATEDAARDALAGRAADVRARVDDGKVVVTVHGADEALVREALARFAFAWELG